MWFAKLFGGRANEADDEPARFAPPAAAQPREPVIQSQSNAGVARAKAAGKQDKSGFDPYNSGKFVRGNAWERVIRR